jgi:hypothetical protein
MAVFALTILASLVALVAGQNANGTAAAGTLGIQAIQANFAQAGLSGSGNLLPTFEPSALMSVSYPVVGACVLISPPAPSSLTLCLAASTPART